MGADEGVYKLILVSPCVKSLFNQSNADIYMSNISSDGLGRRFEDDLDVAEPRLSNKSMRKRFKK